MFPPSSGSSAPSSLPETVPATQLTFQEYLAVSALRFEGADSYDAKDWKRLESIIAPTLFVDSTAIVKSRWEAMPASNFMVMATNDAFLCDPTIKTQRLLGASRWVKMFDDYIIGHHQLGASHRVYIDTSLEVIKLRSFSHATNEHHYRRMPDGVWKSA